MAKLNLDLGDNSKRSENSIEFEISDDLLEFYRESRKFKKEKKEIEKSRLKGLTDGTITEHVSGEQGKMRLIKKIQYHQKYSLF